MVFTVGATCSALPGVAAVAARSDGADGIDSSYSDKFGSPTTGMNDGFVHRLVRAEDSGQIFQIGA